ncbi:hypothetical protein C8Q74DRAFT_1316557 [Fomes fomentarius]|nr:hypothetical protein C8Q74DRAFT_1316557 [Fomes fomentarius]
MPTRLSQSTWLRLSASAFGAIFVAFGINAILRPLNGLTFFPYAPPKLPHIFMGVAIWAAAVYGNSKVLGWIMVAGSSVAFADGAIVRPSSPGGEWNHWGYAPVLTVVGLVLLGLFDRT